MSDAPASYNKANEAVLGMLSGGDLPRYAHGAGRCLNPPIGCGRPMKDTTPFKNELSRKEYDITALCQDCQDGFAAKFADADEKATGTFTEDHRAEMNDRRAAAPVTPCPGLEDGLCGDTSCNDCYPNGCVHPKRDSEIIKGTWAEYTCPDCDCTWQGDATEELRDAAAETSPY